jgi:hypothetical protein
MGHTDADQDQDRDADDGQNPRQHGHELGGFVFRRQRCLVSGALQNVVVSCVTRLADPPKSSSSSNNQLRDG